MKHVAERGDESEGDDTFVEIDAPILRLTQLETGIEGLDLLLRGGLVEGGVYLVFGRPGTGKTTLGNHLAYNMVKGGSNALYVTVMAETHDRMIRHLSGFDFLDASQVGKRIHYMSVYDELMDNGLDGVQATLRRAIRERGYRLVVIDGAGVLEMASESHLQYSRFVADLSAQMSALGCTTVMLAATASKPEEHAISPYVDGIFMLEDRSADLQDLRYMHMIKVRGIEHIRGRHRFTISPRGVEVYPRLESVLDHSTADPRVDMERVPTGVAGLDDILRGGLLAGSTSMVWGPPGVGKTMLGLQFIIEGLRRNELCLMATFHESSQGLSAMADGLGKELEPYLTSGLLRLFLNTTPELPVDDWAWKLIAEVDDHQPRRLVIDGISDVSRLRLEPSRLAAFYRSMTGTLTHRGITTIFTAEAPELYALNVVLPQAELATITDNVFLLRYVEVVSRMHRVLSVLKVRGAAHDHSAREFRITEQGVEMLADGESAARILSAARQISTFDDELDRRGAEFEKMH